MIPDTEEIRLLAGKRLTVVELSDGTVQARHDGKVLPLTRTMRRSPKALSCRTRCSPGLCKFIKDKQAEKDVAKLAKLRTKRETRLLVERTKSVA